MIEIERIRGGRVGEAPVRTNRARIVLGRDLDVADIVFNEAIVHSCHAEIQFQNGRYELSAPRDRRGRSFNGIFLNDGSAGAAPLEGAHPLRHGDRIYLGPNGPGVEVRFLFDRSQLAAVEQVAEPSTPRPVLLIAVATLSLLLLLLVALAVASG